MRIAYEGLLTNIQIRDIVLLLSRSKYMKRFGYLAIAFILSINLLIGYFSMSTRADSPNLIANPSFEVSSNGQPTGWHTGGWGTNSPSFSYLNTGHSGSRSASVTLSGYVSGDAKWYSDPVSVTPSTAYTYSDYYQSAVATRAVAVFTDGSGVASYQELPAVPASTSWNYYSTSLTAPSTAISLTVYHLIDQNGTLTIDDVSLAAQGPVQSTNLLANPSVETGTTTQPTGWVSNSWGSNTATLTYMDGGHTGLKSLYVSVSNYTNGDAKWYANPVAVTAGTTYVYNDYYMSNATTEFDAAYTDATGNTTYTYLGNVAPSNTWQQTTHQFTVPSGTVSVSILHILPSNGWLQTDDFNLSQVSTSSTNNFVTNPSLEIANGTMPASWLSSSWGSNSASFEYISGDAHSGDKSAKVTLSNYVSGDAKWYFAPLTTLTPGNEYTFSAWYKTNTQPHVVVTYVDSNNVTQYRTISNPLPSGSTTDWQHYSNSFLVPQGATSVSVFMLISSNGWLQVDDYSITPYTPVGFNQPLISLTFDDGWASTYIKGLPLLEKYGLPSTQYIISGKLGTPNYMTDAMVAAFQNQGSEIGSHTVTHPYLTQISSTQLTQELSQSQLVLRSLFGPTVAQNFASPYGDYNSLVLSAIRPYYRSHRSTDVGFNSKDNFNAYDIRVQDITTATTPADVAAWVARAKVDKTWLVLVYHSVDSGNGADYTVTSTDLDSELANIKASGIPVKTIGSALDTLIPQL